MKILKLFLSFFLLLIIYTANAQTSQRGFSFQGYTVSNEGVVLSNENINVKFQVYSKTGIGETYEEEQQLVTDFYGIMHTVIGTEFPLLFKKINFTAKNANYWLKVEIKKVSDANYTQISNAEMLAVPYTRYADNGVPVGTIISFAAGTDQVPEGWLVCNGAEYDGTMPQYEQLYNVLENTWGGTGTTFNVPELRGYFLRGFDNGLGTDPNAGDRTALIAGGNIGDNIGSYQTDTISVHNHHHLATTSTDGAHSHNVKTEIDVQYNFVSNDDDGMSLDGTGSFTKETNVYSNHSHSYSGDTDNGQGLETRPKNAAVLYIIKY